MIRRGCARCPRAVVLRDRGDQLADLGAEPRSAEASAHLPLPEEPPVPALPAHHGVRPHEGEMAAPSPCRGAERGPTAACRGHEAGAAAGPGGSAPPVGGAGAGSRRPGRRGFAARRGWPRGAGRRARACPEDAQSGTRPAFCPPTPHPAPSTGSFLKNQNRPMRPARGACYPRPTTCRRLLRRPRAWMIMVRFRFSCRTWQMW